MKSDQEGLHCIGGVQSCMCYCWELGAGIVGAIAAAETGALPPTEAVYCALWECGTTAAAGGGAFVAAASKFVFLTGAVLGAALGSLAVFTTAMGFAGAMGSATSARVSDYRHDLFYVSKSTHFHVYSCVNLSGVLCVEQPLLSYGCSKL